MAFLFIFVTETLSCRTYVFGCPVWCIAIETFSVPCFRFGYFLNGFGFYVCLRCLFRYQFFPCLLSYVSGRKSSFSWGMVILFSFTNLSLNFSSVIEVINFAINKSAGLNPVLGKSQFSSISIRFFQCSHGVSSTFCFAQKKSPRLYNAFLPV